MHTQNISFELEWVIYFQWQRIIIFFFFLTKEVLKNNAAYLGIILRKFLDNASMSVVSMNIDISKFYVAVLTINQ